MNIIIPMAGKGQRFIDAGYKRYKAFLPVNGKTMIQATLENLNMFDINNTYVFIANHNDLQQLHDIIHLMEKIVNVHYLYLNERAKGAADACLQISHMVELNLKQPLIVANCDQIIHWNSKDFLNYCETTECDGCVATFKASSSQHSYAKVLDKSNIVEEIAEKRVISNHALCGVHYWKTTELAMWSFAASLLGPPHYNDDYYIAPTYNELIRANKDVLIYPTDGMDILGTPKQYEAYIENSSTN